jgi:hypothetical protein
MSKSESCSPNQISNPLRIGVMSRLASYRQDFALQLIQRHDKIHHPYYAFLSLKILFATEFPRLFDVFTLGKETVGLD